MNVEVQSQLRAREIMRKNKKPVTKHSRIFLLLFYLSKFFGINTYKLSQSERLERSYPSIIYVVFLLAVYVCSAGSFVIDRKNALFPGETPLSVTMDYVGIAIGFFEVLLGLTLFLIYHDRIESILKSFYEVDKIEMQLEMDDDYERHFYRLAISLTIMDCFYLLRNNSNTKMFESNDLHFVVWLSYGLFGFIPSNILILFVWIADLVRDKFHRLNTKIRTFSSDEYVAPYCYRPNGVSLAIAENPRDFCSHKITMISQLHRELRNAIRLVENHFAVLILLYCVKNLLSLTSSLHITYRFFKGCENFTSEDFLFMLHIIAWIAHSVLEMCVISTVCGSLSNEANETGNLLHAVLNHCHIRNNDDLDIPQLNILFLDVLKNKVAISLLGFAEANHFLLYNVLTTVASYVVIMLQFYD